MGASISSVTEWAVAEVAERVSAFGPAYAKYESAIKENGVDGKMLLELEASDVEELVQSGLHRKRLCRELRELKHPEVNDGPMVEFLNSINVCDAERYAAAMKESGYDDPSEVQDLSAAELMQKFGMKEGFAKKVCRYFANQAPHPPPMPPSSASSSSAPPQPPPPAGSAKQSLAKLGFRWEWCARDGMYIGYEEAVSSQIEQAHVQKLGTVSISCRGSEYVVDFYTMLQNAVHSAEAGASANGGGKGITKVRRWNAKENLPPNWDHHPAGKETHTVEVKRGTAD
jgi:hypothetical protein